MTLVDVKERQIHFITECILAVLMKERYETRNLNSGVPPLPLDTLTGTTILSVVGMSRLIFAINVTTRLSALLSRSSS